MRSLRVSLVIFVLVVVASFARAESKPPNIVIFMTDDQGYADVGVFGAKGFTTPNLDRMAQEGRRFTDFHSSQAVCSASRTGLLTGCYPNRIGINGALGPNSKIGISDQEMTMAQLVKQQGYATAIYGKWHLGDRPQFLPTRHGFDEYFGIPYSNDMWPNHPEAKQGTFHHCRSTKTKRPLTSASPTRTRNNSPRGMPSTQWTSSPGIRTSPSSSTLRRICRTSRCT